MTDALFEGEFAFPLSESSGPFHPAISVPPGEKTIGAQALSLPVPVTEAWQQSIQNVQQFWADNRHQELIWLFSDASESLATPLPLGVAPANELAAPLLFDSVLQPQNLPQLSILADDILQADGAFSAEQQTIFLSEGFVSQNAAEPDAIAAVLLEELGHFLDHELNSQDTPGDEGALFSALVREQPLTEAELQAIWDEDDSGQIELDGQVLTVEYSNGPGSNLSPGEFEVEGTGQVQVELIFDGGDYKSELALFSLEGMEGLEPGSPEYIQEAARRALSNSTQGYIVTAGSDPGRFEGELAGNIAETTNAQVRTFSFNPDDCLAFMLVPNGRVEEVFENPEADGDRRPLFSLAAANPGGLAQFSQLSDGLFSVEDLRRDRKSDGDFEDLIIRVSGLEGSLGAIADIITPEANWLNTANAQQLISQAQSAIVEPDPISAEPEFTEPIPPAPTPLASDPTPSDPTPSDPLPSDPLPSDPPPAQPIPPDPSPLLTPTEPALPTEVLKEIANQEVVKFYSDFSQADIEALAPPSITLGTQTIYIGTQQVTAINQNPIVRSFDPVNPENNWTRTDYEVTGTDGRGMGLFWSGSDLYAVFTVDGAQGTPEEDFRRASQDVEQSWLSSYGAGGGSQISVLGRLDPRTGDLLDAAHLSAVLSNGNSNSFTVDDILLAESGNLVIHATVFFSPRNPDGSRMVQVEPGGSPFDYTLEITPDLKRVVETSAPGWVPELN